MTQTTDTPSKPAFRWCELHQRLLEDLASGSFGKVQSYTVSSGAGTRTFSYRTFGELKELIDYAGMMCAQEEGGRVYFGRTRAGNGCIR